MLRASILVPALNEEATIREVIDRLLALGEEYEIVVIDDGSRDGTPAILDSFGDRIRMVRNQTPSGKGRAIRSGLQVATGPVTVIQDADLEYLPEQIPALVDPIAQGRQVVAYGSRFTAGMPKEMALPNKIVNVLLAWAARLLYRQPITDEATCYKAIRTDVLRSMDLQCTGFEFCPEVTAKVSRLGHRILEIPIDYRPRNKKEGKKIRWTDAPIAFWTLARYLFWRPRS